MAKALPESTKHRLTLALKQWRQWTTKVPLSHAPEINQHLDEGISNTSILVTTAQQSFVVRLDGVDTRSHSLNRQVEWKALLRASRVDLAPSPVYLNPDLGVLVCEYLPLDENQRQTESDVAGLLTRIHSLPSIHQRIDLPQRINQYLHQLEARQPGVSQTLSTLTQLTTRALNQASQQDPELVLCHNDLHSANRLRCQGKLYALDWEYSGMNHRWFDLAVVCECDPKTTAPELLLSAYLSRDASPQERDLLLAFRLFYRYLAWLWYTVRSQQPIHEAELTAIKSALTPALEDLMQAHPD